MNYKQDFQIAINLLSAIVSKEINKGKSKEQVANELSCEIKLINYLFREENKSKSKEFTDKDYKIINNSLNEIFSEKDKNQTVVHAAAIRILGMNHFSKLTGNFSFDVTDSNIEHLIVDGVSKGKINYKIRKESFKDRIVWVLTK